MVVASLVGVGSPPSTRREAISRKVCRWTSTAMLGWHLVATFYRSRSNFNVPCGLCVMGTHINRWYHLLRKYKCNRCMFLLGCSNVEMGGFVTMKDIFMPTCVLQSNLLGGHSSSLHEVVDLHVHTTRNVESMHVFVLECKESCVFSPTA